MPACTFCRDLEETPLTIPVNTLRVHRETCSSCQLLWDAATAVVGVQWDTIYRFLHLPARGDHDVGPLRVELEEEVYSLLPVCRVVIQIYQRKGTVAPWPTVGDAFEVGNSGSSASTIKLAKEWINKCLSGGPGHKGCVPSTESLSVLPARVLDVGTDQFSYIKLHVSREGETGRYCSLSHCWGGLVPITTTIANLDQHIEGIPQPLPKTFMDAVVVTRLLGIQYLWIDSLCILQDSMEDWNTHAPHMASVYGQSYVTISVDAAENSEVGFLDGANRRCYASSSVPFTRHGQTGEVLVRERGVLAYELPYHDWPEVDSSLPPNVTLNHPEHLSKFLSRGTEPPRSALSKRGWAFQERILAPRTLYFGKSETGWECRGTMTCECSATSTRYRRRETRLMKSKFRDASWDLVVQKYTQLDLTKTTDRLVALSGLAAAHYLARTDSHMFGVWRKNLRQSLCWQALKPGKRLGIAPTWSWGSTTSPVRFMHSPNSASYKVIECKVRDTPHASMETNDAEGEIVMQGQLMLLPSVHLTRTFDPSRQEGVIIAGNENNQWLSKTLHFFWDVEDEERAMGGVFQERYTLLIVTQRPFRPAGLVLEALPGNTASTGTKSSALQKFKRVGICWYGDIQREDNDWSGTEPGSSDEERDVDDWRDYGAQPGFWNSWKARSTLQQFSLV